MKYYFSLFCFIIPALFFSSVQAATPLLSIDAVDSPDIVLSKKDSALIRFQMTSHAKRLQTYTMKPIQGVSQLFDNDNCKKNFTLGYNQSCMLELRIDGDLLERNISEGPVICVQSGNNACYMPAVLHNLRVTLQQ